MTEEEARQRVIRAMCPEKVCRTCGEPSRRIVEPTPSYAVELQRMNTGKQNGSNRSNPSRLIKGKVAIKAGISGGKSAELITVGFTDCGHDDWRPGVVLDPFG